MYMHTCTHTHMKFAYSHLAGKWQSQNANSGPLPPSLVLFLLLSAARELFHSRICFSFFAERMEVIIEHHIFSGNLKF